MPPKRPPAVTRGRIIKSEPATTRTTRSNRNREMEQALDDLVNVSNNATADANADAINDPVDTDGPTNNATQPSDKITLPPQRPHSASATKSKSVDHIDEKLPHKLRYLCAIDGCASGAYGFGELCKHYRKAHRQAQEPDSANEIQTAPFVDWLNDGVPGYPATKQAKFSYPKFLLTDSTVAEPTKVAPISKRDPSPSAPKRSTKRKRAPTPPPPAFRLVLVSPRSSSDPVLPPIKKQKRVTIRGQDFPARKLLEVPSDPERNLPTTKGKDFFDDKRNYHEECVKLADDNARLEAAHHANVDNLRRTQLQLEAARRVAEYYQSHSEMALNEIFAWQRIAERNDIDTSVYEDDRTTLLNDAFHDDPTEHHRIHDEETASNRRLTVRAYHTVRRQHQSHDEFFEESARVQEWQVHGGNNNNNDDNNNNNNYDANDAPGSDDRSEVIALDYHNVEMGQQNYIRRTEHREWYIVTHNILNGRFGGVERSGQKMGPSVGQNMLPPTNKRQHHDWACSVM